MTLLLINANLNHGMLVTPIQTPTIRKAEWNFEQNGKIETLTLVRTKIVVNCI